ncbi:hypothetical protein RhiXN_03418 [Rhizoctonia solani]|uniref:Uncharacterized protein n=1 Tax=Rhizoctonia solani TaxID=456999 RepID=A0A8H8SUQ8_9AGAM|nr:uncharacterized protein RhiXN_03418 [Rhizoctonia solani]QRW18494.1 hypothetical protein RhiXN_03418 [Rhizoctonia solani]
MFQLGGPSGSLRSIEGQGELAPKCYYVPGARIHAKNQASIVCDTHVHIPKHGPRRADHTCSSYSPRHASALISGDLVTEIKQLAESEGKQFANDHGGSSQSARSKAAVQASEWNSLLISARASRGPQWDVGLQQYLVDKDSSLYFDPTPLAAANDSGSPTGEGPDGMDLTSGGPNMGNSETGTPITPKTGEDGSAPPLREEEHGEEAGDTD